MDLTEKQWLALEPLFPKKVLQPPSKDGGRPWKPARDVLNGVLWVIRTGAPWADLPRRYPPYQTCHRRFQRWASSGLFPKILAELRRDLEQRGGIEDVEGFIDGTYVPAKKKTNVSASAEAVTPRRSWQLQTALVFQSLSLLRQETDTIPFSQTELSILLSWTSYHRD